MDTTDNNAMAFATAAPIPVEQINLDSSTIERIGQLTTAAAEIKQQGNAFFLVIPDHHQLHNLTEAIEKTLDNPSRKKGTVILSSIESFIQFVQDQGSAVTTYIYADPDKRTLTAIFNDHARPSDPLAGWRDYRAVYQAELSRECSTWLAKNKQPMEQEEFAIFLEDNIADVVEPSGETLLKIALTLQAKTDVNFKSAKRLDNGQVQLTYTETIDARAGDGDIEIPREFTIGVRLFKNDAAYKLRARLKYRLHAGNLKFWYELDRPENSIEDAFGAYIKKAEVIELPVLLGKP